MNRQKLVELIHNPKDMTFRELRDLEDLVRNYPFFQLAHALIAKVRYDRNLPDKEKSLHRAAIYVPNRKSLKKLFYDELPTVTEKTFQKPQIHQESNPSTLKGPSSQNEKSNQPAAGSAQSYTETKGNQQQDKKNPIGKQQETGDNNKAGTPTQNYQQSPEKPQESKQEAPQKQAVKDHAAEERKKRSDDVYKELEENLAALRKFKSQFSQDQPRKGTEENRKDEDDPDKKKMINRNDNLEKVRRSIEDQEIQSKSALKNESENYLTRYGQQDYELPANYFTSSVDTTSFLDNKQKNQNMLIERFIQSKPDIYFQETKKTKEEQKDLSEPSTAFQDALVSENLADIMIKQEKYEKAIDIYKKLIWKFPQKKDYFANKIDEIKNKI